MEMNFGMFCGRLYHTYNKSCINTRRRTKTAILFRSIWDNPDGNDYVGHLKTDWRLAWQNNNEQPYESDFSELCFLLAYMYFLLIVQVWCIMIIHLVQLFFCTTNRETTRELASVKSPYEVMLVKKVCINYHLKHQEGAHTSDFKWVRNIGSTVLSPTVTWQYKLKPYVMQFSVIETHIHIYIHIYYICSYWQSLLCMWKKDKYMWQLSKYIYIYVVYLLSFWCVKVLKYMCKTRGIWANPDPWV